MIGATVGRGRLIVGGTCPCRCVGIVAKIESTGDVNRIGLEDVILLNGVNIFLLAVTTGFNIIRTGIGLALIERKVAFCTCLSGGVTIGRIVTDLFVRGEAGRSLANTGTLVKNVKIFSTTCARCIAIRCCVNTHAQLQISIDICGSETEMGPRNRKFDGRFAVTT